MRQDLVLTTTSNSEMLAQRNYAYRTSRSSSLPLKILNQEKQTLTDKLIHSWNGSLTCTRLCMYTNLSVSDFCINLIGNDLPIGGLKDLLQAQKNQLQKQQEDQQHKEQQQQARSYASSDESNSGSTESISLQPSSSESEIEPETQFVLEHEQSNNNDLTITSSDAASQETSSGYLSITNDTSESLKCAQIADSSLDETCRNLDDDDLAGSSSDDDLFKDFRPKKSCLKKLYIDCEMESANATSSPLNPSTPTSPSFSISSSSVNSTCTSSPSSSSTSFKKRVSFADTNGKELCTIRTMSEPSNCPPKLTSKIVEYFLSREFTSSNTSHANDYYSNYTSYGISNAAASIAVYSLNFAQPAADYIKFRQRLDENKVCLENVVLNKCSISGTIKVKNINFHKQVFVRCSFDKWSSYKDTQAQYVPGEYFATPIGSPSSSYSATFYEANYQPNHHDYDTFRFHLDLPQHVHSPSNNNNNSPHNTIQLCVCYTTGSDQYWDNNYGLNYEILQYVIDIARPAQTKTNFYLAKSKTSSCFRYDSAALSKANYSLSNQSIYY